MKRYKYGSIVKPGFIGKGNALMTLNYDEDQYHVVYRDRTDIFASHIYPVVSEIFVE